MKPRHLRVAAAILAAGAAAATALGLRALRVNTSPSLPRGLYRLEHSAGTLHPGVLVLACPPPAVARLARARGYLPAGRCPGGVQPLGKLVLAAAGDLVDLAPGGLRLNGEPLPATASRVLDSRSRRLPRYPSGRYRVAAGELWLIAPHPRSLDSRTFGPVAEAQVLGVLTPLATLTGADPAPLAARLRLATRHGTAVAAPSVPPSRTPAAGARRSLPRDLRSGPLLPPLACPVPPLFFAYHRPF
ncbi:MAG TPA: conjugative transfer signal peptidase TraF [Thermoanaerobaculia bacterium]|nr:conjugative transfer signal peptidase TraF [Thermoanaerobaculia bacterium]